MKETLSKIVIKPTKTVCGSVARRIPGLGGKESDDAAAEDKSGKNGTTAAPAAPRTPKPTGPISLELRVGFGVYSGEIPKKGEDLVKVRNVRCEPEAVFEQRKRDIKIGYLLSHLEFYKDPVPEVLGQYAPGTKITVGKVSSSQIDKLLEMTGREGIMGYAGVTPKKHTVIYGVKPGTDPFSILKQMSSNQLTLSADRKAITVNYTGRNGAIVSKKNGLKKADTRHALGPNMPTYSLDGSYARIVIGPNIVPSPDGTISDDILETMASVPGVLVPMIDVYTGKAKK